MADKQVLSDVKKNAAIAEEQTSSHISVHPLYTPADLSGLDYDRDVGYPGQFPYTRGVQTTMYRGRLWTMRQYAGMGDAEESNKRYKYLLAQRHHRPVRRLRPAHADRHGLRQPDGDGRSRQGRRRHRFHRGHGAPVRRHPAGQNHHLDDHQRHRRHPAGALHRGGQAPGQRSAQARRHGAERHSQGIHRARHLHLPAGAGDAHRHRHLRLRQPARARVEHHFHQRLPHARGGIHRGAGSRLHPGQRHRLRAGGD